MINVIKTLHIKVTLTKSEVAKIQREIIKKENAQRACTYADIHYVTFKKAITGETSIKESQRDKLMEFCEIIQKGKTAA